MQELAKEKVAEEVKKVTEGQGANATLNVSDHESATATGAAITKMHGKLLIVRNTHGTIVRTVDANTTRISRADRPTDTSQCPIRGPSLSRHKNPR
jgi:hypothetical protein